MKRILVPVSFLAFACVTAAAVKHRNGMPAVGFVNESKLYREGQVDARIALLRAWRDGGVELGNHTLSHPSSKDTFVSPQGISWLHRWLYTRTGATRLKEEPDLPKFVLDAYAALGKR